MSWLGTVVLGSHMKLSLDLDRFGHGEKQSWRLVRCRRAGVHLKFGANFTAELAESAEKPVFDGFLRGLRVLGGEILRSAPELDVVGEFISPQFAAA